MQQNSTDIPQGLSYLVGDSEILRSIISAPAKKPFASEVLDFLNEVSRNIMADKRSRLYSDVITFAFWIRRGSISKLSERFGRNDGVLRFGRGVVFHIAPSNVPVNYAYSLVSGFITGNANVVRIPSKEFPQITIINDAFNKTLADDTYVAMRPYICLVRYGREREINNYLSQLCDVRVIWGGDETINEIRQSPIRPRAGEITFADRFSIAIIDSNAYMAVEDKRRTADAFYNDTYFTDQNACTSPRMVVWTGDRIADAKQAFWTELHELVAERYQLQPIQSVNKLTSAYMLAATHNGVAVECNSDNLIYRCRLEKLPDDLMEWKDNSGYFFEYDCTDIMELKNICNDTRCQTVSYVGSPDILQPLLESGLRGVDRIVPVGKTMDFDLIWDGYDLCERMTRVIEIR